eukprot:g12750.t1
MTLRLSPARLFARHHWGERSCWGPTKFRAHGGAVSNPFAAPPDLKPSMIGKTVMEYITRSCVGGLDQGLHSSKLTKRQRLQEFPWYRFPDHLRDRFIDEIYHRGMVLHDKECKDAFELVKKIT